MTTPFVRDRFTWLAYLMLGYYAYLQATLGPLMPYLRDELGLSYTIGGLHFSAFAVGMVIAGLVGDVVAGRFGRYATFWVGAAGLAAGAILLTLGQRWQVTVLAVLLMSTVGSFMLVTIQATLADRHGERRAYALTESNIVAAVLAALAPLAVGLGQVVLFGWRSALYIGALYGLVMFLVYRRESMPAPDEDEPSTETTAPVNRKLPRAFWAYWLVVLVGVSVEWGVIAWGAEFLETVVGLDTDVAVTLMFVFLGAMAVGRFIGSRLTRRYAAQALLPAAAGMVIVGFPLLWLAPLPLLNVIGLFIAGLGVANLFPMTLSAALTTVPRRASRASARMSLGAGSAMLIAPQVLGAAADVVGLFAAFGIIGVLVVVVLVAALTANRLSRQVTAFPQTA